MQCYKMKYNSQFISIYTSFTVTCCEVGFTRDSWDPYIIFGLKIKINTLVQTQIGTKISNYFLIISMIHENEEYTWSW